MDHKRISDWLKRQLYGMSSPLKRITIKHITSTGTTGSQVAAIDIDRADYPTHDTLAELVAEINAQCQGDADGMGGNQKYVVLPIGEDDDKPRGRFVMRYSGYDENNDPESDIDTEAPTTVGLTSQLMRHNEAIQRTALGATGNIVAMQNRIIARQAEQIEVMQGKHIELISVLEDLRSQKHERDIQTQALEFRNKQTREIVGKVTNLLPVIASKMLKGKGSNGGPEGMNEALIRQLMESMTKEQFSELSKTFTSEQQLIMMQVYQNLHEEDEKKEAASRKPEKAVEPEGE